MKSNQFNNIIARLYFMATELRASTLEPWQRDELMIRLNEVRVYVALAAPAEKRANE